jgi:glycosyltransferase involved in cell wall biosynthesis
MTERKNLKIGYVPYSTDFARPGDRRRFVHYARRRNLPFEIARADQAYDVVVVSEKGDFSVWSRYEKGKVVFDYIDAYLAIPRSNPKGLLRGLARFLGGESRRPQLSHWKALESMCRRADAVICGTEEERKRVSAFCRNTHIILDDYSMYDAVKTGYEAGKVFNLVWEGLPHNLAYFELLRRPLQEIRARRPLALHLVTALRYHPYLSKFGSRRAEDLIKDIFDTVYLYEWNESTAPAVMTSCDLAVIPVPLDDAFAAGRPENKLLIFWKMGIPAVVSAAPAYQRAMEACGLNMACRTEDDWRSALDKYVNDDAAREEAARLGRAYVEANHGEEQVLGRWDRLFDSLFADPA